MDCFRNLYRLDSRGLNRANLCGLLEYLCKRRSRITVLSDRNPSFFPYRRFCLPWLDYDHFRVTSVLNAASHDPQHDGNHRHPVEGKMHDDTRPGILEPLRHERQSQAGGQQHNQVPFPKHVK